MSVCLLRLSEGFDYSEYVNLIEDVNNSFQDNQNLEEIGNKDDSGFPRNASSAALSGGESYQQKCVILLFIHFVKFIEHQKMNFFFF